jgi:hypothetical protein
VTSAGMSAETGGTRCMGSCRGVRVSRGCTALPATLTVRYVGACWAAIDAADSVCDAVALSGCPRFDLGQADSHGCARDRPYRRPAQKQRSSSCAGQTTGGWRGAWNPVRSSGPGAKNATFRVSAARGSRWVYARS